MHIVNLDLLTIHNVIDETEFVLDWYKGEQSNAVRYLIERFYFTRSETMQLIDVVKSGKIEDCGDVIGDCVKNTRKRFLHFSQMLENS
jgi:hypothetical protein